MTRHTPTDLREMADQLLEESVAQGEFDEAGLTLVSMLRQAADDAEDAERYRTFLAKLDPDEVPGGFTLYLSMDEDTDQLIYSDDELNEVLDAARKETT